VRIVNRPTNSVGDGMDMEWGAELPEMTAPAAPVASVYLEPAKVTTLPTPSVARVIASPPAEVTIVTACPPAAMQKG
jgi:hypothetical protein